MTIFPMTLPQTGLSHGSPVLSVQAAAGVSWIWEHPKDDESSAKKTSVYVSKPAVMSFLTRLCFFGHSEKDLHPMCI